MTSDPTIRRLRGANPAGAPPIENAALLRAIVATPPDPRLTHDGPANPRRPRRRRRRTWLLALGAVLGIGGATAWAAGVPDALGLFQSTPPGYDSVEQSRGNPWHQDVIPGSVHRAASTTIPRLGEVQLWFGTTRQGGICTAVRLPDGVWAGTVRPDRSRPASPLDGGSAAPGCQPTRRQVNDASPDSPVFSATGFDLTETIVKAAGPGPDVWRVYAGAVAGARTPVRVVERVSGRSAPVVEGRLFVLAVHDPDPARSMPRTSDDSATGPRLVALDARGRVVAAG